MALLVLGIIVILVVITLGVAFVRREYARKGDDLREISSIRRSIEESNRLLESITSALEKPEAPDPVDVPSAIKATIWHSWNLTDTLLEGWVAELPTMMSQYGDEYWVRLLQDYPACRESWLNAIAAYDATTLGSVRRGMGAARRRVSPSRKTFASVA